MAKARLRRGIELVKLANRIESLKIQEDDPENTDMPTDSTLAADQSQGSSSAGPGAAGNTPPATPPVTGEKRSLSKTIKGAIFREVVLAKVREMKQQEQTLKVAEAVEKEAKRKSFSE